MVWYILIELCVILEYINDQSFDDKVAKIEYKIMQCNWNIKVV